MEHRSAAQGFAPVAPAGDAGAAGHDGHRARLRALELALGGMPLPAVLLQLADAAQAACGPEAVAALVLLPSEMAGDGALVCGRGLPASLQAALSVAAPRLPPPLAGVCETGVACGMAAGWPELPGMAGCWAAPIALAGEPAAGVLAVWLPVAALPDVGVRIGLGELAQTAALVLQHARDRAVPSIDGEFLYRLVHDLRNPLAPLRNMAELLGRAGGDPAMVERARSIMLRQLAQLGELVDRLAERVQSQPRAVDGHADEPAVPPLTAAAPARRVLVADDNDLVRESFVELLQADGYEVRTAVDGLQAIEMASVWQPEVVLLDIHMPRLSGLETARRLREAHPTGTMTLLMMSGITLNDAWVRHARAAGFDDCLDKTADPQVWLARLRQRH